MKRFLKTALVLLVALALTVPAWAFGPAESDVYYEQLSDYAKGIYNAMQRDDIMECLRSGQSYTLTFDGPFNDFSSASQMIFKANAYAFSAFELNHPELFWLGGSSDSAKGNTDKISLTVTPTFNSNWTTGGRSTYADAATVDAAVKQIAEEARAQGGAFQQLLYAHDWLTTHNVYNRAAMQTGSRGAADGYLAWTPLSALTDVSQPVCEGYAKAFKLICDELGIPCLIVDGVADSGHEWNQVKLDGAWYAVDVTFDDPAIDGVSWVTSGYEMHDYFLVGADTPVKGYQTFSDTHTPNGTRIAGTSFTFPALSAYGYDSGSTDWPDVPDEPDWPDDPDYPDDPGVEDPEEPDDPEDPDVPDVEPILFADVDEDDYFANAVDWAVWCGITNGTKLNDENGLNWFSPDATVTRGQAVTFLWRYFGEPEPETEENPFADVKESDFFYKAVLWAVESGITNGTGIDKATGENRFSPKDPVKRGQMLTFLWRSLGKPYYEGNDAYGKIADAEYWAHNAGALGDIAGSYATNAACPRCDVVYYMYQVWLLDWVGEDVAG